MLIISHKVDRDWELIGCMEQFEQELIAQEKATTTVSKETKAWSFKENSMMATWQMKCSSVLLLLQSTKSLVAQLLNYVLLGTGDSLYE